MEIKKVGVMGCGAMGLGVAQVCAQAGIPTVAVKATPGSTDKIRAGLDKSLGKMVERGKMTAEKKDATLGLLQFTTNEADVAGCDLIIESIIEDLETKNALFRRLEGIVSPQALLTTNTSTLSVTAMMAVCKHRARVAGLHFFNPAPVMKLVEIIHAFETSDDTISTLNEFCKKLGKDPVIVQDTTGFIVNRLLTPYMLNAIRMLERGTGTIESIDKAMKLGANHPIGPLALGDLIGLDVELAIMQVLYEGFKDPKYRPAPLLVEMVEAGYLGRKTGRGFFVYE